MSLAKTARDALDVLRKCKTCSLDTDVRELVNQQITKLEAALAQQEKPDLDALYEVVGEIVQTGTCINLTKLHDYLGGEQIDVRSIISDEPQEEQEPVAWLNLEKLKNHGIAYATSFKSNSHQTELYTQPPRREWVELTEEHRKKINELALFNFIRQCEGKDGKVDDFGWHLVNAVESLLKELNT